jgi:Na+-transporting NADH:ubiquinone oxidoreductase subunit NqrB
MRWSFLLLVGLFLLGLAMCPQDPVESPLPGAGRWVGLALVVLGWAMREARPAVRADRARLACQPCGFRGDYCVLRAR